MLLWDNIVITKANKHSQAKNSWKTSAEELEKLFGDSQRFRDINTNGYYMSPKRTRHGIINGEFKLSKKQDQDSVSHPQIGFKSHIKDIQNVKDTRVCLMDTKYPPKYKKYLIIGPKPPR